MSLAVCLLAGVASSQDLEPRRWTHLPVGLNVFAVGAMQTEGDISVDPVRQIDGATYSSTTTAAVYTRTFDVAGRTGRVDVTVPYVRSTWSGRLAGVPRTEKRDGLGDPRVRLSVDLVGAPALKGKEYAQFREEHPVNTIVGAALAVGLPLGEYQQDTRLNVGSNRYSIRPQLGVLHTRGPWSYELSGSAFLFTDNDDFLRDKTLERNTLFALQAHVVRTFSRGWWASVGTAFGWGGENTIDGVEQDDSRRDWLFGASLGMPLSDDQGLSLAFARRRTRADVGNETDSLALAWSLRF